MVGWVSVKFELTLDGQSYWAGWASSHSVGSGPVGEAKGTKSEANSLPVGESRKNETRNLVVGVSCLLAAQCK